MQVDIMLILLLMPFTAFTNLEFEFNHCTVASFLTGDIDYSSKL